MRSYRMNSEGEDRTESSSTDCRATREGLSHCSEWYDQLLEGSSELLQGIEPHKVFTSGGTAFLVKQQAVKSQ